MYGLKKSLATVLCATGLAFAMVPAAKAQPHGEGMRGATGMHGGGMHAGGMHGGRHMRHLRALGLSEAQQDQVFKIFHEQAPAFREQMKQVRRSREEIAKLASAEKLDEARVRQIAGTQAKAQTELAVMHAQTMHRVRGILTPEQRARLDQMHQGHGGHQGHKPPAPRG